MKNIFLTGIPILASGIFVGLAGVSIYGSIVKFSRPEMFLQCTMIYLLGMQIGNALGVQAIGIAELRHYGVWVSALLLAALPMAITISILFFSFRYSAPPVRPSDQLNHN